MSAKEQFAASSRGVAGAFSVVVLSMGRIMEWLQELQIVAEVAAAMMLGGIIGLEREAADKAAGFRTHMIVGGAAALLVALGNALVERFGADATAELIRADPIRIVQGIIIGIGFIGRWRDSARHEGRHVEGLTTAASLLLTGGVGWPLHCDSSSPLRARRCWRSLF